MKLLAVLTLGGQLCICVLRVFVSKMTAVLALGGQLCICVFRVFFSEMTGSAGSGKSTLYLCV